jgi:hypothetical protein
MLGATLKSGSIKQAVTEVATVQGEAPPSSVMASEYPTPQLEEYVTSAVPIVRTEPTAEDSLAAIFERSKLGMAIAAMIRMIATTIKSSIREKPFCFFMLSPSVF